MASLPLGDGGSPNSSEAPLTAPPLGGALLTEDGGLIPGCWAAQPSLAAPGQVASLGPAALAPECGPRLGFAVPTGVSQPRCPYPPGVRREETRGPQGRLLLGPLPHPHPLTLALGTAGFLGALCGGSREVTSPCTLILNTIYLIASLYNSLVNNGCV